MKTTTKFKKIFIVSLLFLVVGNVWGQTSYTSNPAEGTYTNCSTTAVSSSSTTCGFGYLGGSFMNMKVNSISGATINFRIASCNTSFPSGTTIYLKEQNGISNSIPAVLCGKNNPSSGVAFSGQSTIISYDASSFTSGTKRFIAIAITASGRYYSNPIDVTATTSVAPALKSESTCFILNNTSINEGGSLSGSVTVRNIGTSTYNGNVTIFISKTTSSTTQQIINQQNYSISSNATTVINFNQSLTVTPGSYRIWCKYNNAPNGGEQYIENNSCGTCTGLGCLSTSTPTDLITVLGTSKLVCGASLITPTNPIVGQDANFKYTISNTGSANYTGTLKMWIRNSTTVGVALSGQSIAGLLAGNSYTFDYTTSNGIAFDAGDYVLQIEDANAVPKIICSVPFKIVAAPSCITWSGTPPTGDKLTAANYLCDANIIQNTQNGDDNATNGVTRELLAKVTYLSIYKGTTPNSPAVNFPVPFTDMQSSSTQYMDAIKTLAYLQFSDEITPFDRDLINFNPKDLIKRKYALKVLLEAFNIRLSISTTNPYTDVPNDDPQFKYIRTAYELNLLPSGTIFNVNGNVNITREDFFVALWKILSTTSISKPTATQLADKANYFTPGNNRMATMGKVPGIDQANFNHYQKTSFSIAGRGVSLDFTHTYNSFLTELPKGFFEEDDTSTSQKFTPLGIGWTHTYNIYAQKIAGYTGEPDKLMIFYPDGSINTFDYATGVADGIGIYDVMTKTVISSGERITITTKGQIKYVLENYSNSKFYFIKSIKDRNNNGVKCTWQQILSGSRYRLATVQEEFNNNVLGRSLTFTYANLGSDKLSKVTDNSIGRTISFYVDPTTKNLKTFTDAKNQQTSYSYDTSGSLLGTNLLTQIQLPKGNKITNTYAQNKLTQSQTFSQANVATSTTAVNWTPNYSSGQQYNSSAILTDSQNKQTKYTHNTLGNPTQIVSPTGTSTFDSYDIGNNANLPTSLTINGQQSGISYDTKGNILSVAKNGITNAFTYTTKNDVETHTDGKGFKTTYSYDGVGNLKGVQRPSGFGATTIERNSFGQVQSVTNPSGISTTFSYNTNGLTNQISMPLGISTSSTYDDASRLLSTTDANGKKNSFLYDPNDNLTESTDANSQKVTHGYDANDNHLTIKNPKNETQTNNYNWDDDTLKDETFGSHTKSYTYYEDGSLKTHTRGNGTFNYTYFPNGRLQSDGQTSYTYDARGNVKTVSKVATSETLNLYYDPNDRLDYYTDYYGNKVDYSYDNNNNVTEIIYPGNKIVKYTYDAVNRCTDVTDWNTKNTHFDYEADDRIKKITLPNGTYTDYTYDAAGRPTGIFNKNSSGTVLSSYGFTMDNAGNHLTETITEPSITAGLQTISNQTVNYGTAPYNQLQSHGSTTITHNTAGGITQAGSNGFTYDLNDNMLTAPNSSFAYDGAGNRRSKTVNGVNTRYVLSILGMSQVLMETNSSNAVQNYYVYGPTGLLYRVKADNTTYSYYHYDYRGSTTAITNNAQTITHSYSYDPYGKVLAKTEADANPFQYVGKYGVQYESPTLTFMRARYYDPTIGRFLSEDPIWALNLYPYADNNPVMGIDPNGKKTENPVDLIYDTAQFAYVIYNFDDKNKLTGADVYNGGLKVAAIGLDAADFFFSKSVPGSSFMLWSASLLSNTAGKMDAQTIADGIQAATTDVAGYIMPGYGGFVVDVSVKVVGYSYDATENHILETLFDLKNFNNLTEYTKKKMKKLRIEKMRTRLKKQKELEAKIFAGSMAPMPTLPKLTK